MIIPSFGFDLEEGENSARFFDEIFIQKIYALDMVLDVGANRGLFSYFIAPIANKVYAIEPHKKSAEVIEKSISITPGLRHVQVCNCAIGMVNENRGIIEDADGGFQLSNKPGEIEVYTLKSFMNNHGIEHVDLMKIDIENGEIAVFRANDIDDALERISIITGEGHGLEEYCPLLEKHNFKVTKRQDSFIARK